MLVEQATADDIDLLTEIRCFSTSPIWMEGLMISELAISVVRWLEVPIISLSSMSPQRSSQ